MRRNLELNNMTDRVKLYPCALGDRRGTATLRIPADSNWWGQATLADNPLRKPFQSGVTEIEVAIERLDDLIDGPPSFIKIDTEGNELHVLKGAECLLMAGKPGVQVEINGPNLRQFGLRQGQVLDFLMRLGYENFAKVGPEEWWAT